MLVPVVDFSECGLLLKDDVISDECYKEAGHQLYEACKSSGFAYLSKTGLPRSEVDAVNDAISNFFMRPLDYKNKFVSEDPTVSAYLPLGSMTLNPAQYFDYQEGFRVTGQDHPESWPDVPYLESCVAELKQLQALIVESLAGTGIWDEFEGMLRIFVKSHKFLNEPGNTTTMKLIHYPPISETTVLKEGQMRIGEHTDFGSLTLLFQDEIGGLQVQSPNGTFIDVPYIHDTVLVNIGDMMQYWTGGELKSTVHCVLIPTNPPRASLARRSITYFANADDNVVLSKMEYADEKPGKVTDDSSTEYITSKEYFLRRFKRSHY